MNRFPVYRTNKPGTPSQYPENAMRLIWPAISNTRSVVAYHFKNRRRENGRNSTRNWIAAYRKQIDACGYVFVAIQLNAIKGI